MVAGSTWPADEKIIKEAIVQLNLRVILAPHDVSEVRSPDLRGAISVSGH